MLQSIETAITKLPRNEAEELMLLTRRIHYLLTINEEGDEKFEAIRNLHDVANTERFVEQITKLKF